MEEELKTMEQIYREIIESSPDAIIKTDLDGTISRMSPITVDIFGFSHEADMAGGNFLDFIAHEDSERAKRNLDATREKGFSYNLEYSFQQKSGRHFIGMTNIGTVRDEKGKPAGYVITIRDVSRQKKEEWALRRNQDRLRGITEAAGDAIILVNDNKQITFWNPASEELFGYSVNEILGRSVESVIKADEDEQIRAFLRKIDSTSEDMASERLVEIQAKRKDGSVFPAEMAIAGFHYGTRWSAVIVVREIGYRKTMEIEQRRIEGQLRRANAELKRFTSTLSHDLKGSFTGIDTANDTLKYLLEQQSLEDNRAGILECADIIESGIREATAFVNDLLTLARSSQPPEEIVNVDILESLESAKLELSELIDGKKIRISVGPDLGTVRADPTQITRLFTSLLSWLVENNDSSNPFIEVSREDNENPATLVCLVKNNCQWTAPEDVESIFEPSFNGETGRMEIDLPIALRIVRTYCGSVEIADCDGTGFKLTLNDYPS